MLIFVLGCNNDDVKPADGSTGDDTEESALIVTIAQPAPGTTLELGGSVVLAGSAANADGDDLADADLVWVSSIDGPLGSGASLEWTPETAGEHIVTLQAEWEGAQAAASVDVTVTIEASEPHSVTAYRDELGLMATDWRGLAVDRHGDVYGATANGLLVWRAETAELERYTTASGMISEDVHAVAVDRADTVWVGYKDVGVEGERMTLDPEAGTIGHVMDIHFTETGELLSIHRIRIQPYGLGVGDVWFGTNEGLCLYDEDLSRLEEHVHPNHPHGLTFGVAFSSEGDVWNGDQYQLSRYRYTNDGNLDGSDYWEHWVPWPVEESVDPIDIDDMDTAGNDTLYLVSPLHGVLRIQVRDRYENATDTPAGMPAAATAVRVDPLDQVWVGTWSEGLYVLQHGSDKVTHLDPKTLLDFGAIQQLAVDTRTDPPTIWAAGPSGLLRVVGLPEGE